MIIEYEFHVIYNKLYECHSNITKRESCLNTMGLFTLRSNVLHIYSHLIYIYFKNQLKVFVKTLFNAWTPQQIIFISIYSHDEPI